MYSYYRIMQFLSTSPGGGDGPRIGVIGSWPIFMLALGDDIGSSKGDWVYPMRLVGKPCKVLFEKE